MIPASVTSAALAVQKAERRHEYAITALMQARNAGRPTAHLAAELLRGAVVSGNVFEMRARRIKTDKLVAAFDGVFLFMGVDPFSVEAGTYIVAANEGAWAAASRSAGVPLPSKTTRRDVRRTYADRVALKWMAKAGGR